MSAASMSPGVRPELNEPVGFSAFDRSFGALMGRLQRMLGRSEFPSADEVAMWARHASRAVTNGHVCLSVRACCDDAEGAARAVAALQASPLVGRDEPGRPLVLSASGRLYLERYWCYERDFARMLLDRAASLPDLDVERAAAVLRRWCGPESGLNVEQRRAAATILSRRLAVVSGGPGTGKTTTVARALRALQEYHGAGIRIALAAPTGKAAARLTQAFRDGLTARSEAPDAQPAALGTLEAVTLHRLLGLRGGAPRRAIGEKGLALDCLVIDEASMLDLALAAKLARSLPPEARLVLLGDQDQLSSVEAGAIMASLCSGARKISVEHAQSLRALTGEPVQGHAGASALDDCIAELRESFRFRESSGVGQLAASIRDGNPAGALTALQSSPALSWQSDYSFAALLDQALEGYAAFLDAVRTRRPAEQVFEAAQKFRVVCALRGGPFGVEQLNAAIEQRLRPPGAREPQWYPGRMVMVTANDHGMRLYNGDLGIVLPDDSGILALHFPDEGGGFRRIAPARLLGYETAFAITIHKSQGSEFDRVLVVLPAEVSPLATRELLYTAVTRARSSVSVLATREGLEAAIECAQSRDSGLGELLWRGSKAWDLS